MNTKSRNRIVAVGILLILIATMAGVYAVQVTMREIESALPIQVVKEKNELVRLDHFLGDLSNSIQEFKELPYLDLQQEKVHDNLVAVEQQLRVIRNAYKLKNLLGAASSHAAVSPALHDIRLWLSNGLYGLPANSSVVLELIDRRARNALIKVRELDVQANLRAINILNVQSSKIAGFRDVATTGLVVFVLLAAWLAVLIWNQVKTATKLGISEARFRDFASITSDFLWETDKNLKITFLSRKFEDLTGLSPTILLGTEFDPTSFIPESRVLQSDTEVETLTPKKSLEGLIVHSDSAHIGARYLQIDGEPVVDKQGVFQGFRGGARDITDLTLAKKTAEEMKTTAENANKAKTRFLANMSHEIRSPIAIIRGMTDLLKVEVNRQPGKRYLGVVSDTCESLLGLVNRLLDVSKIEADKVVLSNHPFNLAGMIERVTDSFLGIALDKNLNLALDLAPEIGENFTGDEQRIEQVLRNLIDNALKFTESGEINVRVLSTSKPEIMLFSVSDTGIGMSAGKLNQVFDAFVQEDESTTRKYGGTGLGLAISKQLVELMGGEMWVESIAGKGSTFFFTLRLEPANQPVSHPESAVAVDYESLRNLKVLLVEDDDIMALVVQEYLKPLQFKLHRASNGLSAVAMFSETAFDLVLMDISMPKMDGYEAVSKMRELEQSDGRDIPIIALSASVLSSDVEKCLQAGFTSHLSKPVSKESLIQLIQSFN